MDRLRLPFIMLALTVALFSACQAEGDAANRSPKPSANGWSAPPALLPRNGDRLALDDRRPLIGAGAVAFDPTRRQVVWADGDKLHVFHLDNGRNDEIRIDAQVSDLGFAPGGDLWVIAGHATRWRDGKQQCRGTGADLDRLLGSDAAGVVAAGYSYSDGIGPIRHQTWIDNDCRLEHETTEPLPAGVQDSDADPGGKPWRDSLRSPRSLPARMPWDIRGDRVLADRQPPIVLPSKPVALSPDGRWWVFDEAGQRALWRLAETK